MPIRPNNQAINGVGRTRLTPRVTRRRAPRIPSTAGYMAAAVAISVVLFFTLWWMLRAGGDEAPWLPAGLAAGIVMLIAAAAREVIMRRARARYTLELEMRGEASAVTKRHLTRLSSVHASATALRVLQMRLAEAEATGALPEAHLDAYHLCAQYLANSNKAMRSNSASPEMRAALRAGQEHVRALQKRHLLAWTRGEAQRLTREAQRRVRVSDKVETAQQALDVIAEALQIYPEDPDLHNSAAAVHNFVASVKIAHWVELAERAAFRGRYNRAIERYRDALFYLSRTEMDEEARAEAADRITREIDLLRARLATGENAAKKVAPLPATDTFGEE